MPKNRTWKDYGKAILSNLKRRREVSNSDQKLLQAYNITYTDYRDADARGDTLDIWGDFVVPGSDELKSRLFHHRNEHKLYLVTSITEYFFWFIPFTYAEYIIILPEIRRDPYHTYSDSYDYYANYEAKKAVAFISTADKWNHNNKMKPINTDKVSFNYYLGNKSIEYKCGSNDYQLMDCTSLPWD